MRIAPKDYRVNQEIRVREVLVIGDQGEQIGVLPVFKALQMAREQGLDLVEVAPQAQPPVCRLLDYGQFRYSQSKREREARKGQKPSTLREVRFRPSIAEHDREAKVRRVKELLEDGSKVKLTVMFRGREITHPEQGVGLLRSVAELLKTVAKVEAPPAMEGRRLNIVLAPTSQKAPRPAATGESQESTDGKEAEKAKA